MKRPTPRSRRGLGRLARGALLLGLGLATATARAEPPPAAPNPMDPPALPQAVPPPPIVTLPPSSSVGSDTVGDEAGEGADEPVVRRAIDPIEVTGIVTAEHERGDTLREVGNVLLFPPRESLNVLFMLTRSASVLADQQQIVPKINQFTRLKRGEITLFPTVFFDPGRRPSVGALMITGGPGGTSTSVRVGSGGPNEALLETRIALARIEPLPFSVVAEALYDMRTSLAYYGVGQDPEHDPRNHFRALTRFREARYRHQRGRGILSAGVRPSADTEIFLSTSYTQHVIDDSKNDGGRALKYVFVPGTIPGGPTPRAAGRGQIVYTEAAARLDTREERGAPREGAYTEAYFGYAAGVDSDPTQYARFGFRGAFFLSLFRKANILSPKIVVDQLQSLNNAPIPFYELARESDFRGFHTRRDNLSTTVSLDYRWGFAPQISGRLFVDFNSVGAELSKLGSPRWAVGFGQDIYASAHDIGSWAMSFSPDGIGLLLSFGVPSSFGDRQHRE